MNQARITTYEKRSLGEKHAERALSKYHRRALRDGLGRTEAAVEMLLEAGRSDLAARLEKRLGGCA